MNVRLLVRRGLLFGLLGFGLGTWTLLGPVRWLTTRLRAGGVDPAVEDWAVRGVIVLLIAGVATLAWRLGRAPWSGRRRWLPAGAAALAGGALVLWMNPRLLVGAGGGAEEDAGRFVFGPYPTAERLVELRAEGFAGVITLLHPAVAPFEPRLLAEERANARAAGIALVEAPMLPWISANERALARIRAVAEAGTGRYYVHCYLGRDRVGVVRRLLAEFDPALASRVSAGRIYERADWERGKLHHFPDSVHVGPYPTDEEWLAYVLDGSVRRLVTLLDPANPEDAPWIERERALASQYGVEFVVAPISAFPFRPEAALALVRRLRTRPVPTLVHGFLADTPPVEAVAMAYRTGLPPLPPSLFREPLERGPVRLPRVNVAVGPRPTEPEFGSALRARGIREVVFVGPAGDPRGALDEPVARSAELGWRRLDADGPALEALVARGGPWYLYGPGSGAAAERLATAPAAAPARR